MEQNIKLCLCLDPEGFRDKSSKTINRNPRMCEHEAIKRGSDLFIECDWKKFIKCNIRSPNCFIVIVS